MSQAKFNRQLSIVRERKRIRRNRPVGACC